MTLKLYTIEEEYINFLREFDSKVSYNKLEKRPYVGIIFQVSGRNYFAPLSSPKEKHRAMKTQMDFLKIEQGNLGIINLNNAIPVEISNAKLLDITLLKNSSKKTERKYGIMCEKQIIWCNNNVDNIQKKFEKLYFLFGENRLPNNIASRCCNFKALEGKSLEYSKISSSVEIASTIN